MFFYFGFEGLCIINTVFSTFISAFGMQDHFKKYGADTRDVLYFVSVTVLFLSFTVYKLKSFKL
jgi:ABC-2 type transport system permease protein